MTCFTLEELNDLLWEKLESFNLGAFQKKDGSRASWFEEEKPFLLPLPKTPFQLSSWHLATVQFNYHISLDHMHYSVPYQYIKQKVQVKCTANTVEVYQDHIRIASHLRLYGRKGQYSTVKAHMPPESGLPGVGRQTLPGLGRIHWSFDIGSGKRHLGCLQDQATGLPVLYGAFEAG